jgi:integrase
MSVAGAYWKGQEGNTQLQRIYAIAFFTQKELDEHLHRLEEAKRRDHRKLGVELELFSIQDEAGPGLIFWHPKGGLIRKIVEDWLRTLPLANGSRAKIRNLMSALFNHAMRHEWTDRNPIRLVRQSAKRERTPDVLTAEEIGKLLTKLDGPYYVMVFLAAVTGLRVSELLALKWEDVDFASGEILLTRAIVCQHVGPLKTAASQKPVPMDAGLSAVLLDWRGRCPYNQSTDYVFASVEKHGDQPLWPSSAMSKHIRPAAKLAGIVKHVRWHVFRHSFATLLKGNGEDVKTIQESLRHADSKMTLDVYTQGLMPVKRAAQRKVIEAIGPIWTHASAMNAANA